MQCHGYGGQRTTLGIGFHFLFCLRQGFYLFIVVHPSLAGPTSGDSGITVLHFWMGSKNLNLGLHVCARSALPTKSSLGFINSLFTSV